MDSINFIEAFGEFAQFLGGFCEFAVGFWDFWPVFAFLGGFWLNFQI